MLHHRLRRTRIADIRTYVHHDLQSHCFELPERTVPVRRGLWILLPAPPTRLEFALHWHVASRMQAARSVCPVPAMMLASTTLAVFTLCTAAFKHLSGQLQREQNALQGAGSYNCCFPKRQVSGQSQRRMRLPEHLGTLKLAHRAAACAQLQYLRHVEKGGQYDAHVQRRHGKEHQGV